MSNIWSNVIRSGKKGVEESDATNLTKSEVVVDTFKDSTIYKKATFKPLNIGKVVPDFVADSTQGKLEWYAWIGNNWALLLSHPADFTPVCTTELGITASLIEEFEKRDVKVAALSCNDKEDHLTWARDIENTEYAKGKNICFPIIADPDRTLALTYGMIDSETKNSAGLPVTCRGAFIIGPDKKLKLSLLYPASTGRNFNEILRVIDALQRTERYHIATPANWIPGQKCIVTPDTTDEAAEIRYGTVETIDIPSGKSYLRLINDPSGQTVSKTNPKCKWERILKTVGTMAIGGIIAITLPNLFNGNEKKEETPISKEKPEEDKTMQKMFFLPWFQQQQQQQQQQQKNKHKI